MAVNSAIALTGIAKQTASGSAQSEATYYHGVQSGDLFGSEITQEQREITSGSSEPVGVDRLKVALAQGFSTPAFEGSTGAYLLGVYGTDTVTGSGAVGYTHTYSVAAATNYFTFFSELGGTASGNKRLISDAQLDEVGFKWDGTAPIEMSVAAIAASMGFTASGFTTGTDETLQECFIPVGGTFKLAISGSGATDATITAGEISISRGLEAIYGCAQVTPMATDVKAFAPSVKLTVYPTDLSYWRTLITGSGAGTTVSQTPIYGSFEVKFVTTSGSLTFKSQKCAFTMTVPDADPKGGTAPIQLEGVPVIPTANTPSLQAILINDVASY